jgi:hypothetical protein
MDEAKARFIAAMRRAEDLFERADELIETSRRTAHDARNHRLAAVMSRL